MQTAHALQMVLSVILGMTSNINLAYRHHLERNYAGFDTSFTQSLKEPALGIHAAGHFVFSEMHADIFQKAR